MPGFSPSSHVIRREDVLCALVDDELVMLDPTTSQYHRLDRVGLRVWDLLGETRSVAAICHRLEPEFEVSEQRRQADVVGFLDRLERAGLVKPAP